MTNMESRQKEIKTRNIKIKTYSKQLKQSIRKLKESRDEYRFISELLPAGVLIYQNERIVYVNKEAAHLLKYTREELIGLHYESLVSPACAETAKTRLHMIANGQADVPFSDCPLLCKDGSTVDAAVKGAYISYNKLPSAMIVFRDITDRKQSEQKLQHALQYLSDIKFSLDVSSILTITDENGIIKDINDKFCELSKYSKSELIGKSHRIISSGYHDSSFFKNMWETIRSGEVWKGEVRNRAKDGTYYWVNNTIIPFRNEQGAIYQYTSIQHDITAQKETEEKLQEMNERLHALAQVDGLTGIGNRRFFDQELKRQWERAVRDSTPLSAILLDVDYFKLFNDYYGHQAGDECLKSIAKALSRSLWRSGDIVARYGGEEFVVLLPNTDQAGALLVAERIRTSIEDLNIPHSQSEIGSVVTSSLGVATFFPARINCKEDLIATADKALYRSKREGRNQTTCLVTGLTELSLDAGTGSEYQTHMNHLIHEYTSSLKAFDQNTWEHSNRVAYYAIQLAAKMELSIDERQDIYIAGLLHDIGKTSIPFSILNKPTRLTNEEYEIIKEHPVLSYDKLIRHIFMKEKTNLLAAVLHHHERWDGKGYPAALQGENIPLFARILAVADAFDAMTTDRIYKKGLSVLEALEEVKRNKGAQFDPDIADLFYHLFSGLELHPDFLSDLQFN